jgi:hypothetical protein
MDKFVTPKVAAEQLKVHPLTLKRWFNRNLSYTWWKTDV